MSESGKYAYITGMRTKSPNPSSQKGGQLMQNQAEPAASGAPWPSCSFPEGIPLSPQSNHQACP